MQTLIHPDVKLELTSFNNATCKSQVKSKNSKFGLDFRFYQKFFIILLTSCTFLIFPESPQESEALCKKYHSTEGCIVW